MRKVFRSLGVTLGVVLPLVVAAGMSAPAAGAYGLPRCEPLYLEYQTFPPPDASTCPDPSDPTFPPLTPIGQSSGSMDDAQPSGATTLGLTTTGVD